MADEKNDDVYDHSALEEAEADFGELSDETKIRRYSAFGWWLRQRWFSLSWWWRNREFLRFHPERWKKGGGSR